MSIISESKAAHKEAYKSYLKALEAVFNDYHHIRANQMNMERAAINEMLGILRDTDKPLTAAQIERLMNGRLSKAEIASNLTEMRYYPRSSRFYNYCSEEEANYDGHALIPVVIPLDKHKNTHYPHKGDSEKFVAIKTRRRAKVAEIDENGSVIPNTERTVTIKGALTYKIEKV